jgi:hypothetical protein
MRYGIRLASVALGVLLLGLPAPRAAAEESLKEKVDEAIKRGVAYLKQAQGDNGLWRFGINAPSDDQGDAGAGAAALAATALLECGVPATDPVIEKAAAALRTASVKMTYTYSLATLVMFFDRLGDPGDIALIESVTVRLLAGQQADGGWKYQCPAISEAEMRRLTEHIKEYNELRSQDKLPKTAPRKRRTQADLPKEIIAQLVQITRGRNFQPTVGDNSNTQFAGLALWIARKYGLPVDQALGRLESTTRQQQYSNGGWEYNRRVQQGPQGRAMMMGMMVEGAMTCSGLLSLAVNSGAVNDRAREQNPKAKKRVRHPERDPAVRAGFAVVAASMGEPEDNNGRQPPRLMPTPRKDPYYFLWSVERVAMIYGLKTIGKKDWYKWGAETLVGNQAADGSWTATYGGVVDTSFALLFLRRSNLAPDLTMALVGKGGAEFGLSSGGRGGERLIQGKDIDNGLNPKHKPDRKETRERPDKKRVIEDGNEEEKAIARLSTKLVRASREQQEELINEYKMARGLVYTEALAGSIPLLKGAIKTKARAALAERLTRMKVVTLKDKLRDDNLEVRRAAALACAKKKARSLVPDLITLLEDPEVPVTNAARQSLKDLSGQDFGPEEDATRAERKTAVSEWKAWWKKQGNG